MVEGTLKKDSSGSGALLIVKQ